MRVGLFGINMNFMAQPAWAAKVATHAESLGFESLWTGEHVVLPDPQYPPSPAPPHWRRAPFPTRSGSVRSGP